MPQHTSLAVSPGLQLAVGKRIRAARLRKGWNQSVLAEQAGVSRTTLFQMERGAIPTPRAATLHRLATALNIPVSWLNPDEEPETWDTSGKRPAFDPADSAAFDRQTNPYVDVVRQQFPDVFTAFTAEDWDELYSSFGTGGALTEDGVLHTALAISQKRETLRRVSLLLETHLAEPTKAMVDSLFVLIQAPASASLESRH